MAEFAGRCRICLTKNTGHKIQAPQDLLFMRPQTCRTVVAYDRTGLGLMDVRTWKGSSTSQLPWFPVEGGSVCIICIFT